MEKKDKPSVKNVGQSPPSEMNIGRLCRLPWTMADNAMTWLEPTRQCNITCDACFAINDPKSQKSLSQIEAELQTMLRLRRCDAMLIAGGEPLVHPDIVEITRIVKKYNVKPVLITNGVKLDSHLVHKLKKAGAHGFTLHVDSHQSRPGWEGKNEKELNELRQNFADMLNEEGNLTCAFNTTIFPDALEYVPDIVEWAIRNSDRVHILTLIAVRMINPNWPFDFYVGNTKVDISSMAYHSAADYAKIRTSDILSQVRKVIPNFKLCAHLGGTALPHSPKWTLGCRVGTAHETFGSMGPKSMEVLQNFHHFFKGTYLAYTKPSVNQRGRLLHLLGLFDPEVRKSFKKYFLAVLKNPRLLFKKIYAQSINILQPIDILPNGEPDTCDGCPNKTIWKDRLVSACQLDDYLGYGAPLKPVPRTDKDA